MDRKLTTRDTSAGRPNGSMVPGAGEAADSSVRATRAYSAPTLVRFGVLREMTHGFPGPGDPDPFGASTSSG